MLEMTQGVAKQNVHCYTRHVHAYGWGTPGFLKLFSSITLVCSCACVCMRACVRACACAPEGSGCCQ